MDKFGPEWILRISVIVLVTWELISPPEGEITIGKWLCVFIVVGVGAWLLSLATVSFQVGKIGMRLILKKIRGE